MAPCLWLDKEYNTLYKIQNITSNELFQWKSVKMTHFFFEISSLLVNKEHPNKRLDIVISEIIMPTVDERSVLIGQLINKC